MTNRIFNLYCDESRHTSDPKQPYIVIGALQCEREHKRVVVKKIHSLMAKYNAQGEMGWKRLSPNRAEFYQALLELFVMDDKLSFRCIVVDRNQLDHNKYNDGDSELGFYKLYYQMLVHWLQPGNIYNLYLDWQQNTCSTRFIDLRSVLLRKLSGRAKISCLEPVTSHTQPMIQLADLLMGAIGYQWNNLHKVDGASTVKIEFCNKLAHALGRTTLASGTLPSERKCNIFNWQGNC